MILDTTTARPAAAGVSFDAHVLRRIMPHRQHMLLLDRVTAYFPEERRMVGLKNLSQNDPIVQGHFPENPVCPGAFLIEVMAQSCGFLMNMEYVRRHSGLDPIVLAQPGYDEVKVDIPMTVLVDSKIRQVSVAYPGDQVELRAQMVVQHGAMCQFRVSAAVGARAVAHGDIMLADMPYAT